MGLSEKAIVTVNSNGTSGRQRFSLAHELGHWVYHRGQIMTCKADVIGSFGDKASAAEKHADNYAASLLMPRYLYQPALRSYRQLDFDVIRGLSNHFSVSVTAAARRCVEIGDWPAMLVCHNHKGRYWFFRSQLIPTRWFPRQDLQSESSAMEMLFGSRMPGQISRLRCVSAEAWFDRYEAQRYEVLEQSFKVSPNEIITLLVFEDDEMLDD